MSHITHEDLVMTRVQLTAAEDLLALVNEELAAAQELVNHSVDRAMAEATDRSGASR
jgi:hypothetical protein